MSLNWNSSAGERPRDFVGYGAVTPAFRWPGGARLAVNFAINFEEGTERSPLLGDAGRDSRTWVRSALPETQRDLMQEGEYEYGTRAGIWRLLRIFKEYDAPFSVFVSSESLAVNPHIAAAFATANCDMVSHGSRSISIIDRTPEEERADLRKSVDQTLARTGKQILGAFPRPLSPSQPDGSSPRKDSSTIPPQQTMTSHTSATSTGAPCWYCPTP